MNLGEKTLVPVLLYLFHRVEQRLQEGRPCLLIVEEAWVTALNSVFGQKVEEWLRTLRKKNAVVVFVSQSLGDVVGAARRDIILESCPTKIFLPNPEAEGEQVRRLYQGIGLNRRQIELLAVALPKRQYYYTSPLGRRLLSLGLGPVALSFVGMAGRQARRHEGPAAGDRRGESRPEHPDRPEDDRVGHQRSPDDREPGATDRDHGPEHEGLQPRALGHGRPAPAPAARRGHRPGAGDRLHDGERRRPLPAAVPRLSSRDRLVERVRAVDPDDPRYAARHAEFRPPPRGGLRDRAGPHPGAPGAERERRGPNAGPPGRQHDGRRAAPAAGPAPPARHGADQRPERLH